LKYLIYSLILSQFNFSQELNCNVTVNYSLINQTESKIFNELENKIEDFVNSKKWTTQIYRDFEKINCSFFITVLNYSNNSFRVNIEINSFRPVLNSSFKSNNFLFRDNGVDFSFDTNQSIVFSESQFESDLSSLLAFYSLIIIGYDKDTFSENSGLDNYLLAKKILDFSSSFSNSQMWSPSYSGGRINKFWLIDNLTSLNYLTIKQVNYQYHLNGLDVMVEDQALAKRNIRNSLKNFEKINRFRPNSLLQQMFFQSKNDEILNLFLNSQNKIEIEELKKLLISVAPFYANKWDKL
tara:strand:+ start:1319 stop:2206 length:888 start_codon:yes stop_codon:yes gene_type:complete